MFSIKFFTNYSNITRNLKITYRSISLVNKNAEGLLGVQRTKNLTTNCMFKLLGEQSVLHLIPASESKLIHSSIPALSHFNGPNQKKEEMKNYIFFAVLGGICLIMFAFSMTMRHHEDYVFVNPNSEKK